MVSLRRRRLLGLPHGASCSSVLPTEYHNTIVSERTEQTGRSADERAILPINVHHTPSVALDQAVKWINQEKEIIENPASRKQKIYVQVDPENPVEVHAYLMQLKEENILEPDPVQPNGDVPAKEWMEERYPHIFRVFPQNPKVRFDEKSVQNKFSFSNYWLFLFELRNIVLMDYHISAEHVTSLGKVIENLENQGFDCRFMRSELVVVGSMIKQHLEILLEEKIVVASRIEHLEKELQTATGNDRKTDGETQTTDITEDTNRQPEASCNPREQDNAKAEIDNPFSADLQKEYMEVILERYKKVLSCKEEESARLRKVVEEIKRLHWHKPALPRP